MTFREFEKYFENKRKNKTIKEITIDWKVERNTLAYYREKAKIRPSDQIPEWLENLIK